MAKKIIALLISILSLFTLMGCNPDTSEEEVPPQPETNEEFVIVGGTFKGLTEYGKALTEIEIPAEYNGKKITVIAEDAFNSNETVTKIVLPDGLLDIERNAFYKCTALKEINIPDSVETIGEEAFANCESLVSITLPENITQIKVRTFLNCFSLETVNLENIEYIADSAFAYCRKLSAVNFSERLEYIEDYAFRECSSIKTLVIPDTITNLGKCLFAESTSIETAIIGSGLSVIPEGLIRVAPNLKWVVLSESVSLVEKEAFHHAINFECVYYMGTASEWEDIVFLTRNTEVKDGKRYYYSETEPAEKGVYWRYVDGVPTVWE